MKNKPFHQIKDIVCNIDEIIKKNIQFNIISIILSQDIIISKDNMNIIQIHIIDENKKIKMLIENISNLTIFLYALHSSTHTESSRQVSSDEFSSILQYFSYLLD